MKNKFKMKISENIFLAKRNIIDNIYKSAKLEGIAVTYPQTEMIFEGLSVEGMRLNDINTIVNLKNAWYFVIDNIEYTPIDFRYISQVHREISNYNLILNPGEMRTFSVSMGGTNWKPNMPNKNEIDENLDIINKIENATDKALTMMLYLMRTQIFSDGNKRVASLIANQILIQNGAGILSIPVECLQEFRNKLIKYYETNNMEEIKQFLYDNCIDGIKL